MLKLVLDARLYFKCEPDDTPPRFVSLEVKLPVEDSTPCLFLAVDTDDGPVLHIEGHDDIEAFVAFLKAAAKFHDRYHQRTLTEVRIEQDR